MQPSNKEPEDNIQTVESEELEVGSEPTGPEDDIKIIESKEWVSAWQEEQLRHQRAIFVIDERDRNQWISGRWAILGYIMFFCSLAFAFAAYMLYGAARGTLAISVQIQALLVTSIIAEIVAIFYFVVRAYHGQREVEQPAEDETEEEDAE